MLVDYTILFNRIKTHLISLGCNPELSENITHSLMMAEVCGVETHGLRMLKDHISRIKSGFYNIKGDVIVEKKTPSFARVDCCGMVGMDSATKCMQLAIDECKKTGMFSVFANNANTFSAAFVYTLQAANQGMIGVAISNAPAKMPAIGGKQKLLGTNPLSYSIPALEKDPIVFDMATSIVAQSKINMAKDKGEKIPEGWALNEEGYPTTNAVEACKGMILPMAGPKGYGLAMMIDIIAGVLSGAAFLDGVGRFYSKDNQPMNVGHCFIAIDPKQIYGDGFYKKIDDYVSHVLASSTIQGETIQMPGARKFKRYKDSMNNGIEISDSLKKQLEEEGILLNN